MYKVLLSNLKKQRINSLIVVLFVLISAMMMICGVTVAEQSGDLYEDKLADVNGLRYGFYINIDNDKVLTNAIINNIASRQEIDASYFMRDFRADFADHDEFSLFVHPETESEEYDLFKPYAIDKSVENPIYISAMTERDYKYKIGDKLRLNVKMKGGMQTMTFTVGGFYESLREPYNSAAVLPNETFDKISDNLAENEMQYGLAFGLKPNVSPEKFMANCMTSVLLYQKLAEEIRGLESGALSASIYGQSADATAQSLMSFANILSAVLIAFSFIIIIISLCVIWFSITSSIQDDIHTLGIYKSLGYTNNNLRGIMLVQYLFLVLIGSILGIVGGVLLLPVLTGIIAGTVCLQWTATISALGGVFAVIAPLAIIAAVVFLITGKVNKISPVVSMRQGMEAHVYKRNNIPLEKYRGEINVGLSTKSVLNGGKRHFSIGFVVAIMSFLCVFVTLLFFNMNVDMRAIVSLTEVEPCEIRLEAKAEQFEEIMSRGDVEKYIKKGNISCTASGYEGINIKMRHDYSQSEINNIYKGRYPENGHEVTLSKSVGERFNKKIGDMFELKENGKTVEYLVVGFSQSMLYPNYVELNEEGFKKAIDYIYKYTLAEVYLKDGVGVEDFIADIKANYSEEDVWIMDQSDMADMNVSAALKDGSKIMSIIMIVITVVALFMLLLFIIKLKIAKEKHNLAINKAVGYTNFGLMTQVNFALVVIVAIGALFGGVLGALLTNSLLAVFLASYGIMKVNFTINYLLVFGIIAFIIVSAYIIALLLTMSIKKISPRSLLTD